MLLASLSSRGCFNYIAECISHILSCLRGHAPPRSNLAGKVGSSSAPARIQRGRGSGEPERLEPVGIVVFLQGGTDRGASSGSQGENEEKRGFGFGVGSDSPGVAASRGEVRSIERRISGVAEVKGRDQHWWMALHRACFKARVREVRALLEKRIEAEPRDEEWYTALHCPVEAQHAEVEAKWLRRMQSWTLIFATSEEELSEKLGGDSDNDSGDLSPRSDNGGEGGDAIEGEESNGEIDEDEKRQNDSYQEIPYNKCDTNMLIDFTTSMLGIIPPDHSFPSNSRDNKETKYVRSVCIAPPCRPPALVVLSFVPLFIDLYLSRLHSPPPTPSPASRPSSPSTPPRPNPLPRSPNSPSNPPNSPPSSASPSTPSSPRSPTSPPGPSSISATSPLHGPAPGDLGSIISRNTFEQMLKHRNDGGCQGKGFYSYDAFISAAKAFPAFGTSGYTATRKREIAAFFNQTSHETTGGWTSALDRPYAWGLSFVRELSWSQTFPTLESNFFRVQKKSCRKSCIYRFVVV
ncbi:hypothetical protein Fmac_009265 [Flemingia macrophylla]|uniref:Glycoside hydrolase family 19 catalytic domain-containing protein n=1 Tax=Flemingia macrophylla TaxID=520843 RepID=A0ABD1MZQ9_9FABA